MKRFGLLLAVSMLATWLPTDAWAQGNLHRLAAHFNSSGEASTDLGPANNATGGILIYEETVNVPGNDNTLYVTITGTSDQHTGSELFLACRLGGTACRPEFTAEGATGWINLQRHRDTTFDGLGFFGDGGGGGGDLHDNGFAYTWCVRTSPGNRIVRLRLAAGLDDSGGGTRGFVFIENFSVYIDSNNISTSSKRCVEEATVFPTPTGPRQ